MGLLLLPRLPSPRGFFDTSNSSTCADPYDFNQWLGGLAFGVTGRFVLVGFSGLGKSVHVFLEGDLFVDDLALGLGKWICFFGQVF